MSDTDKKPAVGIDLGTTYSCVAVWKNDRVEIIPNEQGNRTTPSYVAFTDNERLVGEAAANQASLNPKNTVFDAKRLIGRRFGDEVVQKDRLLWPFEVTQGDGGKPLIKVQFKGEEKTYLPEEISAMVLTKLKATASSYLGYDVKDAVITCPAYFNDSQRVATKDAGRIAGFNVLRIINEPTAAAMAYGLNKRSESDLNILVFDFGGGTLDVSLVQMYEGMFEVKATGGDTHLGGEDIDNVLVDHFAKEFKRKHKMDLSESQRSLRRLRTACEKLKRTLSTSTQANLEVDALFEGVDFYTKLTQARFNDLCADIFQRCMEPIDGVLADGKITKDQVHEVVLVGGSTRIPRMQQLLKEYFNGKEPCKSIHPDEAVAAGAAVQAAILSDTATGDAAECLLVDVTPLTLGVEAAGGKMAAIVERATPIPVTKSKMFATNHDNQESVRVKIFEGERPLTRDNHCLGTFVVGNIPPQPRARARIEVKFDIDADGILNVSAEEQGSGKKGSLTITNDAGRLNQEQIEEMLETAKKFEEADKRRAEELDWRSSLENYAYTMRSRTDEAEVRDNIEEDEKAQLSEAADAALNWLDENEHAPLDEIKAEMKKVEQVYADVIKKVNERREAKEDAAKEEERKKRKAEEEAAGGAGAEHQPDASEAGPNPSP
eukprot:TRINITY_DN914_c0_g1_i1.p1 TRINITY_DN914_c0_g1~~TRINITY_DN914_c0_g1_i1.p1  ORF type:complete len:661 (+),score=324.84 TRINITY_DN914_c0_g1_i1:50-2032(+)